MEGRIAVIGAVTTAWDTAHAARAPKSVGTSTIVAA